MCNVWRRFPIVPFGSSTFYMCFLSVVKLSLNQRQDKSDGISGIPLYYLYYPIILPLILLGVSTRVLWITLAELVVNPSRWRPPNLEPWGLDLRQDSSERCENGGVLWFRWYPMASRSSHRRGRLFGIQKWKNLGGFHVTLQNDTHCRRFGYALRKNHSLQLRAARERIFFACIFGKCESVNRHYYWQQNLIVTYCNNHIVSIVSGALICHGEPYSGKIPMLTNILKLHLTRGCLLWQFSLCSSYCIPFF